MRVLAIDPGYGRCGMAVVEKSGGPETLVCSMCVETSPKNIFKDRLTAVVDECLKLIKLHRPDALAIEKLYFSKNQKTAMRVAEVRGAIIGCAGQNGLEVFEYSPGQIKNAAAGWGGADKKQVAAMLHILMKIEKDIRYDDEYDAIAIGLTHLVYAPD